MSRLRALLGVLCGVILVGSAAAHSLLGWPAMRGQLERAGAAPDLVTGLSIGWNFAGLAILLFGILALWQFGAALRGRAVSLQPLALVGVAYAAFGVWALVVARMNPFFLMVFVVPGILLAIAAWEGRPGPTPRPIDA
jgi:hypothetical protein